MTMTSDAPPAVSARRQQLERLEAELVALASQLTAATARFIRLVGELDAAEGWADWGMRSAVQWLSWKCGVGPVAAREQVRVARALRDLPLVAAEFEAGRLSYSKVRALTRVATAHTEDYLVGLARSATAAQLDRLLAKHRRVIRAEQVRARRAGDHLNVHFDDDGSLVGSFRIAPERAAAVLAGLDTEAGRIVELGSEAEPEDTAEGRRGKRSGGSRVDALVRMCERSLDDASAEAPGEAAERYQLVLHTTVEELRKPDDADDDDPLGSEVQTPGGGPALRVPPAAARRLSCDCPASELVHGPSGAALHAGRRTRRIRGRLRRAVHARDRGRCRAPGCTAKATQIHHIRHWANGGPTCLRNLISLCDGHHWLVHEGGFLLVRRSATSWALLGPTGVVAEPFPTPAEAVSPLPTDPTIAADAVTGDWSGEHLDYGMALDYLHERNTDASAEASDAADDAADPELTNPDASAEAAIPMGAPGWQWPQSAIDHWCNMLEEMAATRHLQPVIRIDDE